MFAALVAPDFPSENGVLVVPTVQAVPNRQVLVVDPDVLHDLHHGQRSARQDALLRFGLVHVPASGFGGSDAGKRGVGVCVRECVFGRRMG